MHPPPQEPQRDEAAEMASLAAHQQAAMKIVARHMVQKVDTATANHELVMTLLKDQLVELGHVSMDDTVARRAIENEIEGSERAYNELLNSLEEKVRKSLAHLQHGLCIQVSVYKDACTPTPHSQHNVTTGIRCSVARRSAAPTVHCEAQAGVHPGGPA